MQFGFIKLLSVLRAHLILLVSGIGCELIYLFYFVRRFPVTTYGKQSNLSDLGSITQHSQVDFIILLVSSSLLFLFVALAWWEVRGLNPSQLTFAILFLFSGLFITTMAYCYPITAIDVFIYIAQSHVLLTHHANPLITPTTTFAHSDPLMGLAGQWGTTGAPYGPLGILIDAVPTLLAGRNVFLNLMLFKGLFSLLLMVSAWLVYRILSSYAPDWALAGMVLFAWNPVVIFEYSANSHNDVLVMFFVLLALFYLTKEQHILAFVFLIASMLIKYSTIPLFPLFIFYGVVRQPPIKKQMIYLAQALGTLVLLVGAIFIPFWAGPQTLNSALGHDDWFLSSFATVLLNIEPWHLTASSAKFISRIIFAFFYLYALFLAVKKGGDRQRLANMLRGAALVMFMFLAFGSVKFEPWYAIWAIALMALVPCELEGMMLLLFSGGTTLIAIFFSYFWVWGKFTTEIYTGLNSFTYLIAFAPALLALSGWHLRKLLIKVQSWTPALSEAHQELDHIVQPHDSPPLDALQHLVDRYGSEVVDNA